MQINNHEEKLNKEIGLVISKKTAKKRWILVKIIGFLLIACLSVFLIFGITKEFNGEMLDFNTMIKSINVKYLIITLSCILLLLGVDVIIYSTLIRTATGNIGLRESIKLAVLCKFYDNITPFALGSQPMQVYYLHQIGYNTGVATGIVVTKFVAQLFALDLVGGALMIVGSSALSLVQDETMLFTLQFFGWVGYTIKFLILAFIILSFIFPRFITKFVNIYVGIGFKLKLIKNKQKELYRGYKLVNDYNSSLRMMLKKPLNSIIVILASLLIPIITLSIPYFAVMTLGGAEIEPSFSLLIMVMSLNMYATTSAALVPTPGNSGALEMTLSFAFASLFSLVSGWAILLSRFCTFYIFVVLGLMVLVWDMIKSMKKEKK